MYGTLRVACCMLVWRLAAHVAARPGRSLRPWFGAPRRHLGHAELQSDECPSDHTPRFIGRVSNARIAELCPGTFYQKRLLRHQRYRLFMSLNNAVGACSMRDVR
jgi:hypothetical protein